MKRQRLTTLFLGYFGLLALVTSQADATICQPYSRFRIDCSNCVCSQDGTEYSCTRDVVCIPRPMKYMDDDYILPPPVKIERPRHAVKPMPYLDDELVAEPAGKSWQDDNNNDFYTEIRDDDNKMPQTNGEINEEGNSNEYKREPVQLEDVSLGEQNAEEIEDMVPDRFRLKRFVNV